MQENNVTQQNEPAPRRTLGKRTAAVIGGIAVVAGVGVGGLAIANAQDTDGGPGTSQEMGERGGKGGGKGGGRGGDMSATLAEALGKDQETVEQALREVHEEMRGEDGGQAGERGGDRAARSEEMAAALADKLGVSAQDVTDALTEAREQFGAERSAAMSERLTERLDEAVSAGTLTESDKQAVLKAIEAGVLGGPGGPGERGGR